MIVIVRKLLLLRHAKSLWDDPKLSDHARPLNARGRASALAIRDEMRARQLSPDLVLVSSARRTLQTLEALQPFSPVPLIMPMDALYLASPRAMLDVLHNVDDNMKCVLLIGHNPGMHELAMTLVGAQGFGQAGLADAASQNFAMIDRLAQGFPTAGLAEFNIAGAWSALGEGSGQLLHFVTPHDLPEAAA